MLHLKQDLVQVIAPFNDHITGTNQWSFLTKQYVTDKATQDISHPNDKVKISM